MIGLSIGYRLFLNLLTTALLRSKNRFYDLYLKNALMDNVHGINDPDRKQSNNNLYSNRQRQPQNRGGIHGFNNINRDEN